MKILITYVSAGAGHKKIAESIAGYLKKYCPEQQILLTDALEYSAPWLRQAYTSTYDFMVRRAIWLWRFCFWITDLKLLRPISKLTIFLSHRISTRGFAEFVLKEQPDIVISTHFLPSEIVSYLKKTKKLKSRLITVITDYGVHYFWIHASTDTYAVGSQITKELLIKKGIKENRVIITGLPVEEKFMNMPTRQEACRKLGINPEMFTILIITGSFGIGPIEEITKALKGQAQILAVCAKNNSLFQSLKKKNYAHVNVYGFINNVEELMAASDLIITKPGGSTISEILITALAPIFIAPIPGQESENIKVLAKYGIGIKPRNMQDLKRIVFEYESNPQKLASVKERILKIRHANAALELCNVICESSIRPGS